MTHFVRTAALRPLFFYCGWDGQHVVRCLKKQISCNTSFNFTQILVTVVDEKSELKVFLSKNLFSNLFFYNSKHLEKHHMDLSKLVHGFKKPSRKPKSTQNQKIISGLDLFLGTFKGKKNNLYELSSSNETILTQILIVLKVKIDVKTFFSF